MLPGQSPSFLTLPVVEPFSSSPPWNTQVFLRVPESSPEARLHHTGIPRSHRAGCPSLSGVAPLFFNPTHTTVSASPSP